jgi:hypothetical protein
LIGRALHNARLSIARERTASMSQSIGIRQLVAGAAVAALTVSCNKPKSESEPSSPPPSATAAGASPVVKLLNEMAQKRKAADGSNEAAQKEKELCGQLAAKGSAVFDEVATTLRHTINGPVPFPAETILECMGSTLASDSAFEAHRGEMKKLVLEALVARSGFVVGAACEAAEKMEMKEALPLVTKAEARFSELKNSGKKDEVEGHAYDAYESGHADCMNAGIKLKMK